MFSSNALSTYPKVHSCLNPPKKLLTWFSTFGERTYAQMWIPIVLLIRWTDISWFQTRSNTKALAGPCNEKPEADRVEIKIILITKFKTQTAVYSLQVAWPNNSLCLPLLLFLCPLSFQLLRSLVLLVMMLVRLKSSQFTKSDESRKTTFSRG